MLNKRVICSAKIRDIETGSRDNIRITVETVNGVGTAFLDFDKTQRASLSNFIRINRSGSRAVSEALWRARFFRNAEF